MKAIQTKITGPTNYRPKSAYAKAEGVKALRITDNVACAQDLHKIAAYTLAHRYGWLTPQHPRLIGGSLPDGTMAWVFAPAEEK